VSTLSPLISISPISIISPLRFSDLATALACSVCATPAATGKFKRTKKYGSCYLGFSKKACIKWTLGEVGVSLP